MHNKCKDCYFADVCQYSGECDGFTPITEEQVNELLLQEVEDSRQEYYSAWFTYINDDVLF